MAGHLRVQIQVCAIFSGTALKEFTPDFFIVLKNVCRKHGLDPVDGCDRVLDDVVALCRQPFLHGLLARVMSGLLNENGVCVALGF